jgi:hypothetical protein
VDSTPLHQTTHSGHHFLLLCEATIHHSRLFCKMPKRIMIHFFGSIYAHGGDDDVDDDNDVPHRTPIEPQNRYVGVHDDCSNNVLDVGHV